MTVTSITTKISPPQQLYPRPVPKPDEPIEILRLFIVDLKKMHPDDEEIQEFSNDMPEAELRDLIKEVNIFDTYLVALVKLANDIQSHLSLIHI